MTIHQPPTSFPQVLLSDVMGVFFGKMFIDQKNVQRPLQDYRMLKEEYYNNAQHINNKHILQIKHISNLEMTNTKSKKLLHHSITKKP